MASFVPEPMEKCAVCAASPSSTTLPFRQLPLEMVTKVCHLELFSRTRCPSSRSPISSSIRATERSSLTPGGKLTEADSPKPARCQTSECISTMKVDPVAS